MCLDRLTKLYDILSCSDEIRLKFGSAHSIHIMLNFVGSCLDTALQYNTR